MTKRSKFKFLPLRGDDYEQVIKEKEKYPQEKDIIKLETTKQNYT